MIMIILIMIIMILIINDNGTSTTTTTTTTTNNDNNDDNSNHNRINNNNNNDMWNDWPIWSACAAHRAWHSTRRSSAILSCSDTTTTTTTTHTINTNGRFLSTQEGWGKSWAHVWFGNSGNVVLTSTPKASRLAPSPWSERYAHPIRPILLPILLAVYILLLLLLLLLLMLIRIMILLIIFVLTSLSLTHARKATGAVSCGRWRRSPTRPVAPMALGTKTSKSTDAGAFLKSSPKG